MRLRSSLTLLFFAFAAISSARAEDDNRLPATELTARKGVPNFIEKLNAGQEIRVGYLGGSITAAPGWRVKSLKWLQQKYPKAKISEINAAIGGTGSGLGVFRAEQDVISKKPDLLFVEFAVNDGGSSPEKIHRAMEGIVRQTWRSDPMTDICFVYTLSEPMLKDYQAGKFSQSASAMEAIANHYGIPSISFGVEVAKEVTDGKLIFRGTKEQSASKEGPMIFSNDGVHPLVDTGHEIYQQVIARSFETLGTPGQSGPHKMIGLDPFRQDNMENAKIVPITESMLKGKWTKLDHTQPGRAKDFANRMPEMWKTEEPGASLEFIVEGSVAQAYELVGPDGGEVEIQVDDQKPRKALLIDSYGTYHRLATLDLFSSASPDRHTVKVTLTPNMPDKAKILSAENRAVMEKNPALYEKIAWHVGSLLIIGDLAN